MCLCMMVRSYLAKLFASWQLELSEQDDEWFFKKIFVKYVYEAYRQDI